MFLCDDMSSVHIIWIQSFILKNSFNNSVSEIIRSNGIYEEVYLQIEKSFFN